MVGSLCLIIVCTITHVQRSADKYKYLVPLSWGEVLVYDLHEESQPPLVSMPDIIS